jgi:hypothetical protein
MVLACSGGNSHSPSPLLSGLDGAPEQLRADCALAGRKCTQCHPVQRVLMADIDSPKHWQRYVARMRLQPGSNIGPKDAVRIERCLIYRSFGPDARAALLGGEVPR